MKKFKNGVNNDPTIRINIPIIMYIFLYKYIIFFMVSISFFAHGLYISYTIAVPIPNSARFSIDKTLENNPFIPKYSTDKNFKNIVLFINWKNIVIK